MNQNNCCVERILDKIQSTEKDTCNKCSPCRDGRKWIKELLSRQVKSTAEFEIYHNLIIEIAIHINLLSSCAEGKSIAKTVINELQENKLDYYFHLETGKCRNLDK